jgi:hypothetical protein
MVEAEQAAGAQREMNQMNRMTITVQSLLPFLREVAARRTRLRPHNASGETEHDARRLALINDYLDHPTNSSALRAGTSSQKSAP